MTLSAGKQEYVERVVKSLEAAGKVSQLAIRLWRKVLEYDDAKMLAFKMAVSREMIYKLMRDPTMIDRMQLNNIRKLMLVLGMEEI